MFTPVIMAIVLCLFLLLLFMKPYFYRLEPKVILDRIRTLEQEVINLRPLMSKVRYLEKENSFLKERLFHYENPKNSRDSSIPSSRDENRLKRNQSTRKSAGRKPGGQPVRKARLPI